MRFRRSKSFGNSNGSEIELAFDLPPSHPLAERHRNPNRPAKTIADYQEAAGRIVQCQPARPTMRIPHETRTTSIKPLATTDLADRMLHGRTCQCSASTKSPWPTVSCSLPPKASETTELAIKRLGSSPDLSTLPVHKTSSVLTPMEQSIADPTSAPRWEEDWDAKIKRAILTLVEYRVLCPRKSPQRSESGLKSNAECTWPVTKGGFKGLEIKKAMLPSGNAVRTEQSIVPAASDIASMALSSPSLGVKPRPSNTVEVEKEDRPVVGFQPECVNSTNEMETQAHSFQSTRASDKDKTSRLESASKPSAQPGTAVDQSLGKQDPPSKITSASTILSVPPSANVIRSSPSPQPDHPKRGDNDEPDRNKRRRVEAAIGDEIRGLFGYAMAQWKHSGKKEPSEEAGEVGSCIHSPPGGRLIG